MNYGSKINQINIISPFQVQTSYGYLIFRIPMIRFHSINYATDNRWHSFCASAISLPHRQFIYNTFFRIARIVKFCSSSHFSSLCTYSCTCFYANTTNCHFFIIVIYMSCFEIVIVHADILKTCIATSFLYKSQKIIFFLKLRIKIPLTISDQWYL